VTTPPALPAIAGFPGRYVQGAGALDSLPQELLRLGAREAYIVSDDTVDGLFGARVRAGLTGHGVVVRRLRFDGECTRETIDRLAREVAVAPVDGAGRGPAAVVGLGGGKSLDTAKGVAKALGASLAIVPTVASNDSATSRLVVLYDAAHRLQGVELLGRNPDLVLVDSAEIARAPARFLRAGIGDALSKKFEAAACRGAGGANFHGGGPPRIAALFADQAYALIDAHGEAAVRAVEAGRCDADVEAVVEAAVLLSGLGFESGGLSIAHALVRGISMVPGLASTLHGEAVAFGTVVQMLLEPRPADEVGSHLGLLRKVGLRVSLESLGQARLQAGEWDSLVAATLSAPYIAHFPRRIDAGDLRTAVEEADRRLRAAEGRAAS
jgi:glycerol dehydrogenase